MSSSPFQVYLVDDDPLVLRALGRLLHSAGYNVSKFTSAKEFMNAFRPDVPACLVSDISMPEISGLELQRWLVQSNSPLPIIFLTGHGNIPTGVKAVKEGAIDFLTKPVNAPDLLQAIEQAAQRWREARAGRAEAAEIQAKLATLTPREREVFEHVVSGQLNKQIADDLGTAEKTIKVHRGNVMKKMDVRSLAQLVRLAERAGIGRTPLSRDPSPGQLRPR
jgi:FixJ family two-component response regulator